MKNNSSTALKKTQTQKNADSATLTRADIARAINSKLGFSQAEATEILDEMLEEISVNLKKNGQIKLTGFGNFVVRHKAKRLGRNPKTNIEAVISPRKSVTFNASNMLKQKVNE